MGRVEYHAILLHGDAWILRFSTGDTMTRRLRQSDYDRMIRVNHAGELGAVFIYKGQLAFTRDRKTRETLMHMATQEAEHLAFFDAELRQSRARPSLLSPLWKAAGYGLGAVTALLGPASAMACTEAVESVIDGHYDEQLQQLPPSDTRLRTAIAQFREEEREHHDAAIAAGSATAPGYSLMTGLIRWGSRLAIEVAKRC